MTWTGETVAVRTRQAVLVEPGRFEIEERDVHPGEDQVLVKMTACGLCAWELGHWGGMIGECPQTPGHEGVGFAAEVGSGVTRVKVGDRVTGVPDGFQGCFADYFLLREEMSMIINDAPEQELTLGEPIVCVQNVTRSAHPQVGDIALVMGCGPMGLWCIQNLAGGVPGALIAVDLDQGKLELARSFGATHSVNARTSDVEAEVREITSGHGPDVVIDGSGNLGTLELSARILPESGRLVVMSSYKTEPEWERVRQLAAEHNGILAFPGVFPDMADCLRRVGLSINRGVYSFGSLMTHRFPLADINRAFHALQNRPKGYVKGIIVP